MINKVILVGNIGQKPETKFTASGMQITKFSVATTENVKKGDNWEKETEWHNVVTFNKQAQFVADFLDKGSKVYIEGRIKTSSWEDDNGQKKYKTEVIGNTVKSLDKKQTEENKSGNVPF